MHASLCTPRRYAYLDATYISPARDGQPINREYVHVDAAQLGGLAALLLASDLEHG